MFKKLTSTIVILALLLQSEGIFAFAQDSSAQNKLRPKAAVFVSGQIKEIKKDLQGDQQKPEAPNMAKEGKEPAKKPKVAVNSKI